MREMWLFQFCKCLCSCLYIPIKTQCSCHGGSFMWFPGRTVWLLPGSLWVHYSKASYPAVACFSCSMPPHSGWGGKIAILLFLAHLNVSYTRLFFFFLISSPLRRCFKISNSFPLASVHESIFSSLEFIAHADWEIFCSCSISFHWGQTYLQISDIFMW